MIDLKTIIYYRTNTWPSYDVLSRETNISIADFINYIYRKGVFEEIDRVMKKFLDCEGVGHVVLISICSALDSISAYAFGGGEVRARFTGFISAYFPDKYKGKEAKIYYAYRCDGVHGWNLHKSSISGEPADPKHLSEESGIIHLSLYDFFNDLNKALEKYCEILKFNDHLKNNLLKRYKDLKKK